MSRMKRAWLVTWSWAGRHAAVADRIAAIFSSRLSDDTITRFVEFMYMQATLYPGELAYYVNRRTKLPYKAEVHPPFTTCGHNPFLEARVVTDLKIVMDEDTGLETISWMEAPIRKFNEEKGYGEVTREPYLRTTRRGIIGSPEFRTDLGRSEQPGSFRIRRLRVGVVAAMPVPAPHYRSWGALGEKKTIHA